MFRQQKIYTSIFLIFLMVSLSMQNCPINKKLTHDEDEEEIDMEELFNSLDIDISQPNKRKQNTKTNDELNHNIHHEVKGSSKKFSDKMNKKIDKFVNSKEKDSESLEPPRTFEIDSLEPPRAKKIDLAKKPIEEKNSLEKYTDSFTNFVKKALSFK